MKTCGGRRDEAAFPPYLLAWDQLRSSGRDGAAPADDLMAFARNGDWTDAMLATAHDLNRLTRRQWQAFVRSPPEV